MDQPLDVELTDRARSDLIAARLWLTQPGSGLRSRLRLARITRALVELQFSPLRWPEGRHRKARERLVDGPSILIHDITDQDRRLVTVLRIFGPYQDRSSL